MECSKIFNTFIADKIVLHFYPWKAWFLLPAFIIKLNFPSHLFKYFIFRELLDNAY